VTSAACGLLVAAAICGTLIVPIYARITPKIGDFPFFYFYLLAYMPVVALALWVVRLLQRRLLPPPADNPGDAASGVAR
jgi:fucose permease